MTFREYVGTLERELGVEIQIEDDACAFSYGAKKNFKIDILIHGSNEHGKLLTCADIGEPPPVGRERLFRTLLEANDFLGDTAGSTISLNPGNGHARLQRFDDMDALVAEFWKKKAALAATGPAKALTAFANTAAAWKMLIADFRDAPSDDSGSMSAPDGALRV